MDELDNLILEYFEAIGTPGGDPVLKSPKTIWIDLVEIRGDVDKAHNTVARHMQKLAGAGLLDQYEDTGYYMITDLGQRCARGELSDGERTSLSERLS